MPTSKSNVLIVAQPILLMSFRARIANNSDGRYPTVKSKNPRLLKRGGICFLMRKRRCGFLVAGGVLLYESPRAGQGGWLIAILIGAAISFMVIRAISVSCWSWGAKFIEGNQSKKNKEDPDKEDIYSMATVEASGNGRNEGLWGKCFVEADGNETKTKVLYITRRVEQLEKPPLDLSQQETEESLLHWWRKITYSALAIGWLFATYKYRGSGRWDWLMDLGAITGGAIGRGLGLMLCAWILAGLPWLFYKLTKNPLSKRGYILCFIGGCVITLIANLVAEANR